ncbi:MAG: gamma-glutamylcyclotransferase [Proteobacteria bacterium]|nr:gamma-glutamylcyclotransferase [Pseudomonadota bacterium]
MPLYFAYGANMDRAAMARRAPQARLIAPAILKRHRFIIARCGYASVTRDPSAEVHGLLWDASLADLRALDKFEEVDRGLYLKINQPVVIAGGARRALLYVAADSAPGRPVPGYLENVLAAVEAEGFPDSYRRALMVWGNGVRSRPENAGESCP